MSRIENNIATQVGDVVRPQEAIRQHSKQQQQAADAVEREQDGGITDIHADDVQSAAEQLKQVVEAASGRRLQFGVYEDEEQTFVQIKDRETNEMIRQIPSEEVLRLRERLNNLIGMLVEEQA